MPSTGLRDHVQQTILAHGGDLTHSHTYQNRLGWRASMAHLVTHSLTRWRQWPHLIEQGREGGVTHGMQKLTYFNNYRYDPTSVIITNGHVLSSSFPFTID